MGFDFEAFAAECPSALIIVADDGAVLFANRALASLLGLGLSEVTERPLSALVPSRLHPSSDIRWVRHLVEQAGPARRLEWPLLHRARSEVQVEWSILAGHDSTGRALAQITFNHR
ncbi:MAG: PAS domain-containing protein [Polyangiaceae bacterium]|nr:PAS domain-containing protein [Polyangiaceae bacterium]